MVFGNVIVWGDWSWKMIILWIVLVFFNGGIIFSGWSMCILYFVISLMKFVFLKRMK